MPEDTRGIGEEDLLASARALREHSEAAIERAHRRIEQSQQLIRSVLAGTDSTQRKHGPEPRDQVDE